MIQENSTIVRGRFEEARERSFEDITNMFEVIGRRFDTNFGIIFVQNFTDVIIDFSVSFDGEDTTFSLAPNGTIAADMASAGLIIAIGEGVFCKYRTAAPTEGFVQVIAVVPAN